MIKAKLKYAVARKYFQNVAEFCAASYGARKVALNEVNIGAVTTILVLHVGNGRSEHV